MNTICIMLSPECMEEYTRSQNLEAVFSDEIRITGNVDVPVIAAIGLPVMNRIDRITRPGIRPKAFEQYWKDSIAFTRALLGYYGYTNTYIVDSDEGYNLENPGIVNAYAEAIEKEERITSFEKLGSEYVRVLSSACGGFTSLLREYIRKMPEDGSMEARSTDEDIERF